MVSSVTRRGAVFALAGLFVASVGREAAFAQSSLRIARIDVDVSRAQARRGDPTAAWAAETAPDSVARALGARFARGAPGGATLLVHIDDVRLAPMRGGNAPRIIDEIQGSVSLTGPGLAPRGAVIRTIATFRPSARDVPMRVDANRRRVGVLVDRFAQQIPRDLRL